MYGGSDSHDLAYWPLTACDDLWLMKGKRTSVSRTVYMVIILIHGFHQAEQHPQAQPVEN
jgi:hypothetical protein